MPQITMENASLYGSFLDSSDREMILSSVASFVSKQASQNSISAKQTTSSESVSGRKGGGGVGATVSPFKHDLGIIQNSLTHNGITEQSAVPLSRNRPASERHRRREVNSPNLSPNLGTLAS